MKNKKGKKLVVLGAMAALLTLIGVSGSQTYAKYIEETDVASTTATVAKWGFVASANADNLFVSNHQKSAGISTKYVFSMVLSRISLVIVSSFTTSVSVISVATS